MINTILIAVMIAMFFWKLCDIHNVLKDIRDRMSGEIPTTQRENAMNDYFNNREDGESVVENKNKGDISSKTFTSIIIGVMLIIAIICVISAIN